MTAVILLAVGILVGLTLGLLALVIGSAVVLLVARDVALGVFGRDVFEEIIP